MESVLILVYTSWAIYSGYKVMTGRSEWLDRREPVSLVCKCVLSVIVGYIIGAFYFIYLILQFLGFMSKM